MLGKMLKINLNWTQVLAGTSAPLLESQYNFDYIQQNWFTQLLDFSIQLNATIKIKTCWQPTLQRENDFIIMDKIIQLDITKTMKQIFNNWRIYYQVDSISDVSNIKGNRIEEKFLTIAGASSYISNSVRKWPNQQIPSLQTFPLWAKLLQEISDSSADGNISNLGSWVVDPKTSRTYTAYRHSTNDFIIMQEGTAWWKMVKSHSASTKTFFVKSSRHLYTDNILKSNYLPIDAGNSTLFYYIYNRHQTNMRVQDTIPQTLIIPPTNICKFLRNKAGIYEDFFRTIKTSSTTIFNDQQYTNISICSDGGCKDTVGSIGVIIKNSNGDSIDLCSRIPLIYNELNSHRCECFGILVGVNIFIKIQQYVQQILKEALAPQTIFFYCDNKAAIDTINYFRFKKINLKQQTAPNMDLIKGIISGFHEVRKNLGRMVFEHVDGHQDRQKKVIDKKSTTKY
jgi:ribonuclease HI